MEDQCARNVSLIARVQAAGAATGLASGPLAAAVRSSGSAAGLVVCHSLEALRLQVCLQACVLIDIFSVCSTRSCGSAAGLVASHSLGA